LDKTLSPGLNIGYYPNRIKKSTYSTRKRFVKIRMADFRFQRPIDIKAINQVKPEFKKTNSKSPKRPAKLLDSPIFHKLKNQN